MEMSESEMNDFNEWKRTKNKSALDEAFFRLEQTLEHPERRQFNTLMPSMAYRTLAEAILALKKELIK